MRTVLVGLGVAAITALASGCDKGPTKLDEMVEASTMTQAPPPNPDASPAPAPSSAPGPSDASPSPSPASTWDGSMPPRPIPKPSLTVGSGMPTEVQLKTIGYMNAMVQPRFDDAPADTEYASGLLAQLRPILTTFDKGPPDEKQRLDRVDSFASGRRIDLLMAEGCNAELPRAAMQRIGVSFVTLLAHGVLVVRCNDARVQCLQSTRDPSDILCTTAPRHR
jgi:hypothetical protein